MFADWFPFPSLLCHLHAHCPCQCKGMWYSTAISKPNFSVLNRIQLPQRFAENPQLTLPLYLQRSFHNGTVCLSFLSSLLCPIQVTTPFQVTMYARLTYDDFLKWRFMSMEQRHKMSQAVVQCRTLSWRLSQTVVTFFSVPFPPSPFGFRRFRKAPRFREPICESAIYLFGLPASGWVPILEGLTEILDSQMFSRISGRKTLSLDSISVPEFLSPRHVLGTPSRASLLEIGEKQQPNFPSIHPPLEGPTRKRRHASVFSTHSDTQAVPAFHCIMFKGIFSTRTFKTHRHEIDHCVKEVQNHFDTLVFLKRAFRHARVRF